LLLDQEASYRRDRRLRFRLRYARLRHQAADEDIDYRASHAVSIAPSSKRHRINLTGHGLRRSRASSEDSGLMS